MKITLKTLQGKQLPLEIEETATVAECKQKIEAEHSMPADKLKLISVGKVLQEQEKTLADYGVKEGGFLIVMQEKPKTNTQAKPAADSTATPAVTLSGAAPQQTTQAQPAPVQPPAQQQPTAPVTAPVQQPQAAAQQQPAAPVDEATVETLVAISGKTRDECVRALQAAFGNPDRAFEYLQMGIPQMAPGAGAGGAMPGMPGGGQIPPGLLEAAGIDDPYGDEEGEADEAGLGDLAAFAQNPQFNALRQRILQDPQFYQEFMQMLQQQQPQLYQVIQQNPMGFMNLILTGGTGGPGAGAGAGAGMPQMPGMPGAGMPGMPGAGGMPGMPGAGAGGAGPGGPNQHVMRVSPDELAAIERLQQLGFSQNRAAQAFFACDKNEEFAANFLFEQAADDDDDAMNQAVANSTGAPQVEQPAAQQQPAAQEQPAAQQEQQQQPEGGDAQPGNNNNEGAGNAGGAEGGEGGQGAGGSAFDQ